MSKVNKDRKGCRDVFHAYFVEDAEFEGKLEIPYIDREKEIPERLISFTDALRTDDEYSALRVPPIRNRIPPIAQSVPLTY